MIAGPGHNNGPTMEGGKTWRTHCWKKARTQLIPHLPIEILRGRVRRAKELGLEYKTYASVRAATGRDVVGFLFSSNALRAYRHAPTLPADRQDRLAELIKCKKISLVSQPLTAERLADANPVEIFDGFSVAPSIWDNWPTSRNLILNALRADKIPADGVVLIGDATLEQDWSQAGRLAGYVAADRYFDSVAS